VLPLVIVTAAVALSVGLVARTVYHRTPATPQVVVTQPAPSSSAAPSALPGSPTIGLTVDAAANPMAEQVRQLLQAYFDSINNHDFDSWAQTVTSARRQSFTPNQWQKAFRSSKDGTILVYRIESAGDGELRVLLSFVSTQSLDAAPADFQFTCIRWQVVYPLSIEDGNWRLDVGPTNKSPEREQC
jgi:hypothetical protein